jgi:hypothetical protein
VVYWCNSYTIVHCSLDIIEWFKYKLKKVFKIVLDTDSPPSQYQQQTSLGLPPPRCALVLSRPYFHSFKKEYRANLGGTLQFHGRAFQHGKHSGSTLEVFLLAKYSIRSQPVYQVMHSVCHC